MSDYCDPDYFCNCDDCVNNRGFEVCKFCGVGKAEDHDDDCPDQEGGDDE